jgi:hypothetical protein
MTATMDSEQGPRPESVQSQAGTAVRLVWAITLAIVSCYAWLVLWELSSSLSGLADLVETVLRFGGSGEEPPWVWYHIGFYGQWLYGAVALLVVLAVLMESRLLAAIAGAWFLVTLLLGVAGYFAFDGSVGTILTGVAPVGLAAFALVVRARKRAA